MAWHASVTIFGAKPCNGICTSCICNLHRFGCSDKIDFFISQSISTKLAHKTLLAHLTSEARLFDNMMKNVFYKVLWSTLQVVDWQT